MKKLIVLGITLIISNSLFSKVGICTKTTNIRSWAIVKDQKEVPLSIHGHCSKYNRNKYDACKYGANLSSAVYKKRITFKEMINECNSTFQVDGTLFDSSDVKIVQTQVGLVNDENDISISEEDKTERQGLSAICKTNAISYLDCIENEFPLRYDFYLNEGVEIKLMK